MSASEGGGRGIKGEGERVAMPNVTGRVWIYEPFSLSPALSRWERESDRTRKFMVDGSGSPSPSKRGIKGTNPRL
jgi:hypothetical protein